MTNLVERSHTEYENPLSDEDLRLIHFSLRIQHKKLVKHVLYIRRQDMLRFREESMLTLPSVVDQLQDAYVSDRPREAIGRLIKELGESEYKFQQERTLLDAELTEVESELRQLELDNPLAAALADSACTPRFSPKNLADRMQEIGGPNRRDSFLRMEYFRPAKIKK